MTIALQLGNVMDGILIGNILGMDAVSAANLASPVEMLIQLPGYVLGIGSGISVSVLLGKRDRDGASKLFSSVLFTVLFTGLLIGAAVALLSAPLGALLSQNGSLSEMTASYILGCAVSAPVIGVALLFMNYLGADNHPALASAYIIVANVIKMIADFCLLKFTSVGVMGASLSTGIGFLLAFLVLIVYIKSPVRMTKLVKPDSFAPVIATFKTGVPVLLFVVMSFVMSLGMNNIVLHFMGNEGAYVLAVFDQVLMIVEMLTGGIIAIIPNISGLLYSEKDFYGIKVLFSKVLVFSAVATVIVISLIVALAPQIAALFGMESESGIRLAAHALRILAISIPFYVWNKFLLTYYESIEEGSYASVITVAQNGAMILPLAAVIIPIIGNSPGVSYDALAICFILAEALTVASPFAYRLIKREKRSLFFTDESDSTPTLDISVSADIDQISALPVAIIEFCVRNGVSHKKANLVAVAAEEMAANTACYGGKRAKWIDVCLVIEPETLRFRIRDNGTPFNPIEYEYDREKYDSIHGIELVKAISTDMNYIRALDMNNTVIEFDISDRKRSENE